jgi:hypothetical protein
MRLIFERKKERERECVQESGEKERAAMAAAGNPNSSISRSRVITNVKLSHSGHESDYL